MIIRGEYLTEEQKQLKETPTCRESWEELFTSLENGYVIEVPISTDAHITTYERFLYALNGKIPITHTMQREGTNYFSNHSLAFYRNGDSLEVAYLSDIPTDPIRSVAFPQMTSQLEEVMEASLKRA